MEARDDSEKDRGGGSSVQCRTVVPMEGLTGFVLRAIIEADYFFTVAGLCIRLAAAQRKRGGLGVCAHTITRKLDAIAR